MRRVVVFILVAPDGRVLLERKPPTHPNEPGLLVFPGGHVEARETDEDAIVRELREEYRIPSGNLAFQFLQEDARYRAPGGTVFKLRSFVVIGWDGMYSVKDAGESRLFTQEDAMHRLDYRRRVLLRRAMAELTVERNDAKRAA